MRFWSYVSKSIVLYLRSYHKGGNHKIDIYKQTISAVYTPEEKRENSTQQREGDSSSLITHGGAV